MKYISGIHALNLSCSLDTCGDWHTSALRWKDITFRDTEGSILNDYGVELGHRIPEHSEIYNVANHIRALLDLIIEENFATAQGMREDFICNENYTAEIFQKIWYIKSRVDAEKWKKIDRFMQKEYKLDWIKFKGRFT